MSVAEDLQADVLVIGGGMAGAWAALGAARAGAQVLLVDKGHCGTSGITASAGPGHWWVPPAQRDEAVRQRALAAQGLAEPRWMLRILDLTWRHLPTIATHYRFGIGRDRQPVYRALRGPEYLRALRQLVEEAGVRVLDHHPALELLRHADGSIAGAAGVTLPDGGAWQVRAGAVVLASGGCAFLSRLLGADNNTGDGGLMAAEAGAELSGMEFTNAYCIAPAFSSMTRSMSYVFARYFDADGRELPIPAGPEHNEALARALLQGPVFCTLADMPQDLRDALPTISPNVLPVFQRRGIDPFTQRFPVTLRAEGTVRGVGGLRVASDDCESTVKNLFVAGDAASREHVTGAISGGGNVNSAWALASGLIAGRAAATRVRRDGRRADAPAQPLGQAGLRPAAAAGPAVTRDEVLAPVKRALHDYDRNVFRSAEGLRASQRELEAAWEAWRDQPAPAADARSRLRTREAAALLANARWSVAAALRRDESRGMHRRVDAPLPHPRLALRLAVGGLERVWLRPDAVPATEEVPA